jgi:hypothetical protein
MAAPNLTVQTLAQIIHADSIIIADAHHESGNDTIAAPCADSETSTETADWKDGNAGSAMISNSAAQHTT